MKTWFTSEKGTLTLSVWSLLAFIGYTLMEMRFFMEKWIPGEMAAMMETIVILALAGIWLRALLMAAAGRGGRTALLALSGFAVLIALYDLQWLSSNPWPEATMILVMLALGVLAVAALALQRRSKTAAG